MSTKNRHPADRLGEARAAKKEADAAFEAARDEVIETMDEWNTERLEGEEYTVDRSNQKWRGQIDTDKMLKDGIDAEHYRKPGKTVPTLTPKRKKRKRAAVRPSR